MPFVIDASVVAWGEVLATSADELVNQEPGKKHGPVPAKLEAAVDMLRGMLANGPMRVDDILRCAKSEGISRSRVYEAAHALIVGKCTLEMRSAWRLPENSNSGRLSVRPEFEPGITRDDSKQET